MSFTARDWSKNFEVTKKRLQNVRGQGRELSSGEHSTIAAALQQLDSQLKTMENCPLEFEMFPSELARRRVLLSSAQKLLNSGPCSKVGSFGSGNGSGLGGGGGPWGKDSSNNSVQNPLNMSDRGLAQRQQQIIGLQDEMLGDISRNVDRLHGQAVTIGDQAKEHGRILESLEQETDGATSGLQAETAHAKAIKDKAQVCWLYVCVAVEFVLLFLLVILGFTSGNL